MIIEISEAWLIHKYWSGDTSVYVFLFSKDYGLIKCLFKGGRTPKKQALLQPFQPLWVAINQRREFNYINKLECTGLALSFSGENLFAALYINEIIFYFLKINDTYSSLYKVYFEVLRTLSMALDRKEIEQILRRFERILLTTCGYHLSFDVEARTHQKIDEKNYYQFIPGEGFVRGEQGFSGQNLLAIAQDKFDNGKTLIIAKKIMRMALAHILDGKEIKTRRLYRTELVGV